MVNCDNQCGKTWKIVDIIPEVFFVKHWLEQQVLISILKNSQFVGDGHWREKTTTTTTNMRVQCIKVER